MFLFSNRNDNDVSFFQETKTKQTEMNIHVFQQKQKQTFWARFPPLSFIFFGCWWRSCNKTQFQIKIICKSEKKKKEKID